MYNPIDLKFHLQDHYGVSVIEMKDGFKDEISDLDDVIVLYKDNEIDTGLGYEWEDLMVLEVGDDVYDLRLVVESSAGVRTENRWTGTVYSRHGGMQYQSWWKQERKSYFVQQTVDGIIDDVDLSCVDMLVYVKVVQSDVNQLKKDFFDIYGGSESCML